MTEKEVLIGYIKPWEDNPEFIKSMRNCNKAKTTRFKKRISTPKQKETKK